MNEIEVRDALFRTTGVHFEIREPNRRDLDHFGMARWFLICREVTEARRIPYVNIAWGDKGNAIWLESVEIGDSLEWIYQHYGDTGVASVKKVNLIDFPSLRAREELGDQFPKLMRRFEMYEKFLKNSSEKHGAHLEMRYQSSKERTSFRLAAKILVDNRVQSVDGEIGRAVKALGEAYDNICKYEAKIL
jgi:hypothetical protein